MEARVLRADAFASITRILEAARRVLAVDGAGSLERIAREAGVGIATLYRHFPNRQMLARAVFERIFAAEIEPVLAAFDPGAEPRPAMLELAERLADIADRERGLADSLGSLTDAELELLRAKTEAFAPLLSAAQRAGSLRGDLVVEDIPNVLALMVSGLPALGSDKAARRRYLSLMLDALNPATALPLPALDA